ncbi:MAG: saccharopine dehydrogenase NADP-binding domain-containing protein [Bacteroidales bacterium]|jgi:saccharopine dehydrogenase-like NADP-dependent oxidoreductase|nr:saccharopine dehydrogenase NADP-binding domain-containing protein [Bacteroidales bacterium]
MTVKPKVLVMGAGLVGLPMAKDLIKDHEFEVSIADINPDRLLLAKSFNINTYNHDLTQFNPDDDWCSGFEYYINAVPGAMGFEVLKKLIRKGKPVVDIAFYPENPLALNESAIQYGSCVICDMGVAPGMSHLLCGYASEQLDKINNILIYVGGLPSERTQPWEYKAVFSPADVIEEYTRPARLIEYGRLVEKPALTDIEQLHFEGIGTLEAFNSDGLRSLITSLKADFMAEKTLRYPGHAAKVKLLRDSGFLSDKPIEDDPAGRSPLSLTQQVLFKNWLLQAGEADFTVMRIIVEGIHAQKGLMRYTYELFDQYDSESETHSMARTTGYAATSALRLIHAGLWNKPGIHFPETIGQSEKAVRFMLEKLSLRGIFYEESIQLLT